MKLYSVAFFTVTLAFALVANDGSILLLVLLPFLFGIAFGVYGIARSYARHLDPLNDVPNALRVFLASLGGYFAAMTQAFVFPSIGLLLLVCALFLNDEFQRRALHAMRTGRRGGSIALLGIDGSGKSSHAAVTGRWLEERGYRCTVMPFHRYIFVERLASISTRISPSAAKTKSGPGDEGNGRPRPFRRGGNPLRPLASLLDNLLLQVSSSVGCRLEGRVVIYDRFIWSTYVKYKALGYPVQPISGLYLSPRPTFALVLDVPVEKSLRVIDERVAHIHYPREVLESEKQQYLEIARRSGYPVIDATLSFEQVQEEIESHLGPRFPPVGSGAKAN